MPVVSVSMPEQLLEELNEFIEDHGYSGRSEAIRQGARGLLNEFDEQEFDDQLAICVIATMFDQNSEIEATISELRHTNRDLVTSNIHSHAGDACIELFIVEGTTDTINSYITDLRSVDSAIVVDYLLISAEAPVSKE